MAQVIDAASKEVAQWAKELADILSILFKSGSQARAELLKVMASKQELKKIAETLGILTNGGKESIHWCAFDESQQEMCKYVQNKLAENNIDNIIVSKDSSTKSSIIYCNAETAQQIQRIRMMYAISKSEPQYCHRYDLSEFSEYATKNHVVILQNMDKETLTKLQTDNLGTENSFPFTTTVEENGTMNIGIKAQHFMSVNGKDVLTMLATSEFYIKNEVARYEYNLDRNTILNEEKKDFYVAPLEGSKKGVFLHVTPEGVSVYNSSGMNIRYIERPNDEKGLEYFAAEVLGFLKDIPTPCYVTANDLKTKMSENKNEVTVLSEHARWGASSDFVRINENGKPISPRAVLTEDNQKKLQFSNALIKATEQIVIKENIERNIGCYEKLAEQLLMSIYNDSKDDIQLLNSYKEDFKNALVDKVFRNEDYASRDVYQKAAQEAFREVLDEANGILSNLNHEYGAQLQNDNYEKLMFNFTNTIGNYSKDVVVIYTGNELTQQLNLSFNSINEKIKLNDTNNLPSFLKKEIEINEDAKELADITREKLTSILSIPREEFYAMSDNELRNRMTTGISSMTAAKENSRDNIVEQAHIDADKNRYR